MKGKRVVGFFDMFDEIPNNGKYLFSRKVEIVSEETDEEIFRANRRHTLRKGHRAAPNSANGHRRHPAIPFDD